MKLQVIKNRLFKIFKKLLLAIAYAVLIFFFLSFTLLHIPYVQHKILDRYTSKLNQIANFKITYDQIYLLWWDRLEIENMDVIDPKDNLMIHIGNLEANFKIASLLKGNNINIDGVILDKAAVNLINISDTDTVKNLNLDLFIKEISNLFGGGGGGNPPKFNIGEIAISNTDFSLHDPYRESKNDVFDYNHIQIAIDEAAARNFKIIGDTIEFNMNSLIATETNAKLPIENLSTFFRISQGAMEFYELNAKIGKSYVADTLVFKYLSMADLSDITNKVNVNAKLAQTIIYPEDLQKFTDGRRVIDQPITLSGKLSGRINRLFYNDMEASLGESTIKGSLTLDGLPTLNETFINLSVNNGRININDLKYFIPERVFQRLESFGRFSLSGKFLGFINDFVANGNFRGKFGEMKSDINLKIHSEAVDRSFLEGNLALNDFDLGLFFRDSSTFQHVTLNGNIHGTGLTQETADFKLRGEVSSIGIRNYNYTNISTDARFAKEQFNGKLIIDDPNVQLTVNGALDLRKGHEVIKINANLDSLNAHKIGLIKSPLFIHSVANIDTKGLQLDSLFGTISLKDTFIKYKDEELELDTIFIISFIEQNKRNLNLQSSYADANLKGDFYFSSLFNDIQRLIKEFQLNIKNNKEEVEKYYSKKPKQGRSYEAAFNITLNDINPLLKLWKTGTHISNDTHIVGKFFNGFTSGLQAYSEIDTVDYLGKKFIGNEIDFSGSKISDSTTVLAMLTVQSSNQQITSNLKTSNLFTEAIWDRDHIVLNLDFDQIGRTNFIRLKSEIDFLTDSTRIKIHPSNINLLEKNWEFNEGNFILIKGREIFVHDLQLSHEIESILISGYLSEDKDKEGRLLFNNVNLDILNAISQSKFKGTLNGNVEVKDIYHSLFLQNEVRINELVVDDFLIGDLIGTNVWNQEDKQFEINVTIDRLSKRTLTLHGYYNPSAKSPLDVIATMEKTNIKIIEPFLKGIFSQMDGTLSGVYKIKGTLGQPLINGEGIIEGGKIMIDYLKTLYSFNGKLKFTHNQIIFEDFTLQDALNNKGSLDGYLTHKNFDKFRINLDAEFTNLQLLNLTTKDNDLFYGQAWGTGNLNMLGPLSNIKISATATTSKNTKIYIPISGTSSVEQSEFVSFISFKDTVNINNEKKKKLKSKESTGITLDLNLDITPDAYAEIIFDIKAGDIIRGYGRGDIKLQLDTKGEFNMFGVYQFERGNYNFTLYDIINKEFNITKGSMITWYGDPYAGILNVTASYRQLASLSPILANQLTESALNSPQIKRKYPVEVILKLDGPMLTPQIQFDIIADDLPSNIVVDGQVVNLELQFNAFKAQMDEQELKRQVFSLIVLRRFSPLDAFSMSGSIYNSVSELLSNQLSYWLNQVDQNLEINLDLGSMDNETYNTFQLRLSYSFLNGRLRVTRDGTYNNQYNRSDVASMLGDWTVDYLLTADGKLRVKMYSRSNLNSTTSSTLYSQSAVTTGISLLHTQTFNEIKDLLRKSREKGQKEAEKNPPQEEAILEEND